MSLMNTRLLATGTKDISYRDLEQQLWTNLGEVAVVAMYLRLGYPEYRVVESQSDVNTIVERSGGEQPTYAGLIWCASKAYTLSASEYRAHTL